LNANTNQSTALYCINKSETWDAECWSQLPYALEKQWLAVVGINLSE